MPVGQDLSTKILVDITKLKMDLKKKSFFKVVDFENEQDDFSSLTIKTIHVFEYEG